jgi:hypothetical protein
MGAWGEKWGGAEESTTKLDSVCIDQSQLSPVRSDGVRSTNSFQPLGSLNNEIPLTSPKWARVGRESREDR